MTRSPAAGVRSAHPGTAAAPGEMVGAGDAGPCVLALDVGSSSVRAQLYDARGRSVGPAARREYGWDATPDGGMTVSADEVIGHCVGALDDAVAAAAGSKVEIAGVGIDTFWHSLVGVGADGACVTPLFGWGDTRARGAAAKLRERVDVDGVHCRTGCFVHGSYPAAKLLWLHGEGGDSFPRAAGWMSVGELLAARLFGERRCSFSMASGTGLFDLHRLAWDAEMMAAVGVDESMLSPLVDTDAPFRGLAPDFARRWPSLADVPWLPALGDGACATVGSGAATRGSAALTVGTSAAVRVLREEETVEVPPGLWCYRLDGRRAVFGRAFSNGGNVFAWLHATLRLPEPAELEAVLAEMEPGSHGLTVDPSLVGERPPAADDAPHACIAGLGAATTPAQVVHACMEAVAYRTADALEALERAFGTADTVVADGGALHASAAWAQLFADVLGRPLRLSAEAEATARGAALVMLERLGHISHLDDAPDDRGEKHEPREERRAQHARLRGRQRRLEALLAEFEAGEHAHDMTNHMER
ncbi:MAG TPA: gluconokinase [Longimicrobiaceae bacterium]|nr:gluconokinase [Longimicrobiaceae bacterium]